MNFTAVLRRSSRLRKLSRCEFRLKRISPATRDTSLPKAASGEIRCESTPRMAALPRVGSRIFMRILIVVVLPAPLAPISAYALPSGAVRLNP